MNRPVLGERGGGGGVGFEGSRSPFCSANTSRDPRRGVWGV